VIEVELPGGRAVFTGRAEADLTDDDAREALAAQLGVSFARGRQVHGADVRRVSAPSPPVADGDGQATALRGVAPYVQTADCLPVALISPGAVAMVHAGWRGLAAGVLQEGVRALRELGAGGEIAAVIGPGAGPCCYEAGEEVHAAIGHSAGRNVDLKAAAAERLRSAGVAEVEDVGICTIHDEAFFSHRRSGGITGRQVGVVWLD
jgi:polyphenol oxidase